ncbi:hypothetical protein [Clostridium lacusfryxellense]|uniref:hypothetical protein n=1 Tax=Clostridium lacusfryxellense TaxID=205328 RepID=UPI001C0E292B|nr:hypothetical protein [Clostridium lacusfryxellense]MBU3110111.1 hypothetical protein [Clostridium lacusfryxellense]
MDFKNNFSKITKSLSESASNVVQKSNELIAVSALNGEINDEEKKKDIIYIAIGKVVYNSFINKAELSEEIKQKCEAVLEHNEQIKIIMEKIINVKRIKKCPNCGTDMNISIKFCPDCGVMQKLIEDDNII